MYFVTSLDWLSSSDSIYGVGVVVTFDWESNGELGAEYQLYVMSFHTRVSVVDMNQYVCYERAVLLLSQLNESRSLQNNRSRARELTQSTILA